MPRRREEAQQPMWAGDILIVMAEQYRKSGEVDPAMADAFIDMLRDGMGVSITTTEAGRRVSERGLDPDEHAAMAIVGTSLGYVKDQGDDQAFIDIARVAITLAMRFPNTSTPQDDDEAVAETRKCLRSAGSKW